MKLRYNKTLNYTNNQLTDQIGYNFWDTHKSWAEWRTTDFQENIRKGKMQFAECTAN